MVSGLIWAWLVVGCADAPSGEDGAPSRDTPPSLDTGEPSPGDDTAGPPEDPPPEPSDGAFDGCRNLTACPGTDVCDLALGRCEPRSDWTTPTSQLFAFHPPEVAEGDLLVIDGTRFFSSLFGARSVEVDIGGQPAPLYPSADPDDTRVLVTPPAGAAGELRLTTADGDVLVAPTPLAAASSGVIPCDGTTPTGAGVPGPSVDDAGPHAAGFVDLGALRARVFYPAQCGSVRRPPVPGRYPLVMLMHGNGAGFMAMEYLGQLLATWGFVSVQAHSIHDDVPITDAQVSHLLEVLDTVRDADLGAAHPVLAGLSTTAEVGFVGHSRGTARTENVLAAGLDAHTVAVVFLGVVDDGLPVTGLYLQIDGTHDRQSPGFGANQAWSRGPRPKWRVTIDGGNHSLFTDHVVWTGFLDDQPTVSRRDQQRTVTRFTLPLMQRAFGLDELFADQLDATPPIPGLTVEHTP
jgi:hypothetical protein